MKPQPRYQRGDRIANRYLVHQALLGGMGEVYLCLDLEQNYPFALKTFQQRYLTDAQRLRRAFEQEVATWVALEQHPNIVRCFWMQLLDNQPFMCLEWIAGEEGKGTDLRSWLRHGPLDLKLALQIAIDLCNGLLHAQEKRPSLVHRDLKPENILMAQDGLAKITDFGLAQIAQTAGLTLATADTASAGRHTMIGDQGITGTPAYMAPEQWRGEPLDARTDIYALGCILYELLTGDSPFSVTVPATTPNRSAVWLRTLKQAHEQAPVTSLPRELPAVLNALVQHCLAKAPSARPPGFSDLVNQLTQLYQQHVGQSPPLRPAPDVFSEVDYNNRAVTYSALGQRAQALTDYTHALTIDPNYAKAYANRGSTYAELGQREAALADYTHALTLDPTYATAYYNRGLTYAALGQREAALADYTHALTLDPTYATAYNNRGLTYAALEQWDAALADFTYALTIDPTYATAYNNRGLTYAALGQREAALADFTQALTVDPNYAKAYYNRGNTYQALGQREAALADFTQALTVDPNYAKAYYNRGVTYAALQQWDAALADYTRALTLDPHDAQAYVNRGNTYAALGQELAALADYTQTITLAPTLAPAYFNIGALLYNQGKLHEALTYLEQAAHLGLPEGTQFAALVRQRLGLESAAKADLAQAAFAAFQQADSLAAMQQAVTRYPLLLQPDFIVQIEQAIAEQLPPEHRPPFTQRLAWLRQIANTQPRSIP